ncbi:hypothetical protein IEQ34_022116 [Dendrobium chrysotoxum]|uniref:Uncharacterized protein n=1 Tax=Dendrobium chrysotoxum TaxID=161865 RepID=A0AAV7FWC0_DENCH|nr:hypothetical protein IEQ34_022116 [Dendrobium chrysotoxum]
MRKIHRLLAAMVPHTLVAAGEEFHKEVEVVEEMVMAAVVNYSELGVAVVEIGNDKGAAVMEKVVVANCSGLEVAVMEKAVVENGNDKVEAVMEKVAVVSCSGLGVAVVRIHIDMAVVVMEMVGAVIHSDKVAMEMEKVVEVVIDNDKAAVVMEKVAVAIMMMVEVEGVMGVVSKVWEKVVMV